MTEAEINEKAREIYTRCFDDECEYTGVLNALVIAVRETARGMAKKYEKQKEINKELEKENAELKKKNLDTQDAVTMQMYTNKANKEIADMQLTKAKEIIRSLYFIIQGRIDYKGNIPLEDEMYRANQFLNSEVEE